LHLFHSSMARASWWYCSAVRMSPWRCSTTPNKLSCAAAAGLSEPYCSFNLRMLSLMIIVLYLLIKLWPKLRRQRRRGQKNDNLRKRSRRITTGHIQDHNHNSTRATDRAWNASLTTQPQSRPGGRLPGQQTRMRAAAMEARDKEFLGQNLEGASGQATVGSAHNLCTCPSAPLLPGQGTNNTANEAPQVATAARQLAAARTQHIGSYVGSSLSNPGSSLVNIRQQFTPSIDTIGVHSWRKCVHTKLYCGSTARPMAAPAYIRGGHSMGKNRDVYIAQEKT